MRGETEVAFPELDLGAFSKPFPHLLQHQPARVGGAVTFQGLRAGPLTGFAAYFEVELAPGLIPFEP